MRTGRWLGVMVAFGCAAWSGAAFAAACGNTGAGFNGWLADFKGRAVAAGIPRGIVETSLAGVSYDPSVIRLDRNQRHFKLSFQKFYATRGAPLESLARSRLSQNAALLKKIEARYGVPGAVVVAIWGLETGFGANVGKSSVMRSLATLAYDCRRSAFFTEELYAALKVAQRGDLKPSQMRGAWAGEMGQTQFLATSYLKYAVDFDGNGRRDLISSRADALGSTANYLRAFGWKPGQSWQPGTANYAVLASWNRATVYQQTIATLATRIGGS